MPNNQHPHPLRPINLVPARTDQIDPMIFQRFDQFSECLSCIHVKPRRVIRQPIRHFCNRLNHSGLIVRMHEGNQQRGRANPLHKLCRIDAPISFWGHPIHLKPILCKHLDRLQNRLMLNPAAHNMGFPMASTPMSQTEDRQVITFCRPASEDHLFNLRIHQPGNLLPCLVDCCLGPSSKFMSSTSLVSVLLFEKVPNQLPHFRLDGGRSITVHVDGMCVGHKEERMPEISNFSNPPL